MCFYNARDLHNWASAKKAEEFFIHLLYAKSTCDVIRKTTSADCWIVIMRVIQLLQSLFSSSNNNCIKYREIIY